MTRKATTATNFEAGGHTQMIHRKFHAPWPQAISYRKPNRMMCSRIHQGGQSGFVEELPDATLERKGSARVSPFLTKKEKGGKKE
jgi:hypothetical protein